MISLITIYQISSVNVVNVESRRSATIHAKTKPIPVPVEGYAAQGNEVKKITLSWRQSAESDINAYRILSGKSQTKVTRRLKDVPAHETSYRHGRLKDGVTRYYRILAIDNDGLKSDQSDVFHATTKPRPQTPSGFSVDHLGDEILIQWNQSAGTDIQNYEVKVSGRFQLENSERKIKTQGTSLSFQGLKPGSTGKFKVRAIDLENLASDYTKTLTVKIPKLDTTEE